jgi:hypothetical protein
MKLAFAHSEPGKAVAYVHKVAMDLVKARRENGHFDKVCGWKKNVLMGSLKISHYMVSLCLRACIKSVSTSVSYEPQH